MPFVDIPDRQRRLFSTWTPANTTTAGGKDAPTIVLVHGLGSTSSFYAPVTRDIALAGYSCLALDSHGAGLTAFTGQDGGIDQIVQDVTAALQALNIPPARAVVVGHSMGGIVASELAARLDLAGAVLLGPVHPNEKTVQMLAGREQLVTSRGMEAMADTVPTAGTGPDTTDLQRAFIRALVLSQGVDGYLSNCRAIASARVPDYAAARCPLLILAGAEDVICPSAFSEAILNGWGAEDGKKRIQVIPRIGHWHCVEAPAEVSKAIIEFAHNLDL